LIVAWCGLRQFFGMFQPIILRPNCPTIPTPSFRLKSAGPICLALRPFGEAQVGVEAYVWVGGDITIGGFCENAPMLRDQVTGQRFSRVQSGFLQGQSLTVGSNIVHVFDSAYLPDGGL
jgi:hypothetical protein